MEDIQIGVLRTERRSTKGARNGGWPFPRHLAGRFFSATWRHGRRRVFPKDPHSMDLQSGLMATSAIINRTQRATQPSIIFQREVMNAARALCDAINTKMRGNIH
jgi:hypothetical protein